MNEFSYKATNEKKKLHDKTIKQHYTGESDVYMNQMTWGTKIDFTIYAEYFLNSLIFLYYDDE